jgi:hypothetical protein
MAMFWIVAMPLLSCGIESIFSKKGLSLASNSVLDKVCLAGIEGFEFCAQLAAKRIVSAANAMKILFFILFKI